MAFNGAEWGEKRFMQLTTKFQDKNCGDCHKVSTICYLFLILVPNKCFLDNYQLDHYLNAIKKKEEMIQREGKEEGNGEEVVCVEQRRR